MGIFLKELAAFVQCEFMGDPLLENESVAPFELATVNQITMAENKKFLDRIESAHAGAFITPKEFSHPSKNIILAPQPRVVFAKIANLLHPSPAPQKGIHKQSVIGEGFEHGKDCTIGPFTAIGRQVRIGNRVIIHPNVTIGDGVQIGDATTIYPNVTIYNHCRIGNRVIIHAGTVIGSDGYGFASDGHVHHKIPQLGIVEIEDDVEIGAINTIDRATFGKTHIKSGVKTDNMVHIAHNVTIGKNTIIVAQVGIAGSVTIGNDVILAGQSAVSGHLTVEDNVIVGPRAGIVKNATKGQVLSGAPAIPHSRFLKASNIFAKLPELKKRIEKLEQQIKIKND